MRRAARRDANETQIVSAAQACGAFVKKINGSGEFDLLVYYRGHTMLWEVKDGRKPPSAQALTPAEEKFHEEWPGDNLYIVNSVEAALDILKRCT